MTSEMKRAAWRGLEGRLVLPRDERPAATTARTEERAKQAATAPEPPNVSDRNEDEGTAA